MGLSAFPHPKMETHKAFGEAGPIFASAQVGLTKRELFAAMAMQGLLSGCIATSEGETIFKDAVELADSLLTELEKRS